MEHSWHSWALWGFSRCEAVYNSARSCLFFVPKTQLNLSSRWAKLESCSPSEQLLRGVAAAPALRCWDKNVLLFLLLHQHSEGSLVLLGWFWSSVLNLLCFCHCSTFLLPDSEVWGWEWTNSYPFPWGCASSRNFSFPLLFPISLWEWNILEMTLKMCFNGVVLVPVGSPCPGALCAFPRNARLAFGLRDTNVPEPSCHAGLWVLGSGGVFGTQWCYIHFLAAVFHGVSFP